MYGETIQAIVKSAESKQANLERSLLSHLAHSLLAGMYVGVGIVLIFSIGAPLDAANSPFTKLVMGACFGGALTLVIVAGAELFTGNNLVLTLGWISNQTTLSALGKNWTWTWIGNLLGSMLLAALVVGAGTFSTSPYKEFLLKVTAAKMSLSLYKLFLRGILANWLVCLAVWQATRLRNEAAKVAVIFWCLFAFVASGFEHSIANMTLLSIGLFLSHGPEVTWLGFGRNLVATTGGNIVGGALFVAWMYWLVSRPAVQTKRIADDVMAVAVTPSDRPGLEAAGLP